MKPIVYADTRGMSREEWLRARKSGIGGSDAAAILGLNPYSSPLSVWADKISADEPHEKENESMWLGNVLEDHVARRFAKESGTNVVRCNMMLQHPKHTFMLANIDRRIKGKPIGIEIKTTSQNTKTDFENGEINPWYYVQCMHYLAVTGWEKWILVVLVIGRGMYTFEINRDENEISALIDAEAHFWEENVKKRQMPPTDGTQASADALSAIYPESNGQKKLLDCEEDIARYTALDMQIKTLTAQRDAAKQRICEQLGEFETGVTANYTVKWKTGKAPVGFDKKRFAADLPDIYSRYITSGTPSRRFTVVSNKEA